MKNPSNLTPNNSLAIVTRNPNIDFEWCLRFFERNGKTLYGPGFYIAPCDYSVIYRLLIYFLGMEREAEALGIDLGKGILLTGPIGCGKTTWLKLMRLVVPVPRAYAFRSCRDISLEFCREGYEVIYRYSHQTLFSQMHCCFDDLGIEQVLKHYGNECNIMGEILLTRYDLGISAGMITHASTNQSASELEQLYGNRLRSRMGQMFNLMAFPADSPDKRK
jgi:hypothetical protein